jgi:chemotaxis protein CheD
MTALTKAVRTGGIPDTPPGFERIKRYWDRSQELVVVKALPGEVYVTTQSEMINTVLGSFLVWRRVFAILHSVSVA